MKFISVGSKVIFMIIIFIFISFSLLFILIFFLHHTHFKFYLYLLHFTIMVINLCFRLLKVKKVIFGVELINLFFLVGFLIG